MSERRYVRSFVALSALQMLPLGLVVPVEILVMQARGLGAGQIGAVVAVVGLTTALLELPTGGLADVLGRRVVLVTGSLVTLASLVLFATATGFTLFLLTGALFALGKALESGPLESWFVDAVHDLHPPGEARDVVLTRGLGRGGAAAGLALAAGAVTGGLLAEVARRGGLPADGTQTVVALSVPLLIAAALVVANVIALVLLMDPHPHPRQGLAHALGGVGPAVADAGRLVVTDAVLRWFGLRWLIIPTAFLAFELVTPIRLTELLADPARAAAVLGPLAAACFVAQGVSAALAPWLRRRTGALIGAGLATVGSGAAFALAGPGGLVGLVVALVLAHLLIGPVNALTGPYLHARVPSSRRATLLSLQSVLANVSVGLGAVGLGLLVDGAGTAAAFAVAGVLTAVAALPLIGVARAARRHPAGAPRRLPDATTAPPVG